MTSPTICNSGLFASVEQMNFRKGSESSTTRTRRVDVSKFHPLYVQTRLRESNCWLDSESHIPRLRSLRGRTDEFFALSEPSPEGQDAVTFTAHPNWDALRGTVRHQGGKMCEVGTIEQGSDFVGKRNRHEDRYRAQASRTNLSLNER